MKKLLIVLLCAGLVLSMTACGSGAGSETNATGSEETAVTDSGNGKEVPAGAEESSPAGGEASTSAGNVTADAGVVGDTGAAAKALGFSAETDAEEPDYEGLDPSVHYQEGEMKVADTDLYSLTVTGYDPDYHYEEFNPITDEDDDYYCFAVFFRFENKSDRLFKYSSYEAEGMAVNRNEVLGVIKPEEETEKGESTDPYSTSFEVEAGETMNGRIQIQLAELEEAGITSVDELIVFFTGELGDDEIAYVPEVVHPYATIYPTGKKPDEIIAAGEVKKEDMTVITETEDLLFGVLPGEYADSEEEDASVKIYFQNKSDRTIDIELSDIYVNGKMYYEDEDETQMVYSMGTLAPGCHRLTEFVDYDNYFLTENGFDSILEWSGTLKAYELKEGVFDFEDTDDTEDMWHPYETVFYEEPFSWKAEN